jgi:hypothetical protein
MDGDDTSEIARLRDRAAQCRRRAGETLSGGIAVELRKLAVDYEREAARIEAMSRHHAEAAFQ